MVRTRQSHPKRNFHQLIQFENVMLECIRLEFALILN